MNNTIVQHNNDFTVLKENSEHYETCVSCQKITNVPKMLHIDFRNHYVEGAGQLCFDCYTKDLDYIKD